jgi:adenosine kinase
MTVASKTDNEYFLKETLNHNLPLFFGSKMDKSAFPPRFIKRIISSCTGVFANEKESEYIRTSMKTENLKELFKTIPKLDFIIITKGKLGSYAMVREGEQIEEYSVPIVPAKKFVDAVGSGDAYIAGFLYGYLEKKTVKECMQYGATLASFVIEGMGATTTAPSISNLENRYQISFLQGDIK